MNLLHGGRASKHPSASGPSNPYRQPFRQRGEDRHLLVVGGFFVTGAGSIKGNITICSDHKIQNPQKTLTV